MKKIVLLSILVIIGVLFGHQIRRAGLSLLILADSVRPSKQSLMGRIADGPAVKTVRVPGRRGRLDADLYVPRTKGRLFPLLLVHGADPAGKDGGLPVLLAKDFARAGFLVLVPDLKGMKNLHFGLADAEDVLESFRYLTKHERARPGGAMIGMNFGSGPMLLAAADARIRDRVDLVAAFGGYYDLRNVLLFGMTGNYEYGGRRGYVRPQEALRWMIAYKNLDLMPIPAERDRLRKIIEHRNRYELDAAASLAKALGPEGRALYDFLLNADQHRFVPLYEKLPLAIRERVYQLSPSRALNYIKASFIIAHATDDYAVPYTESLRIADAVGDEKRVEAALLPQFFHGETGDLTAAGAYKQYVVGGFRLFSLIYDLLERAGV